MKDADDKVQEFSPQVLCDPTLVITPETALQDFQFPSAQQQGLMYCYCKNKFNADFKAGNNAFEPQIVFSDGINHCKDWLPKYMLSSSMTIIVPTVISFLNYICKILLNMMAVFEKH